MFQKQPEHEGFNNSFFTTKNIEWGNLVINWFPNPEKPLVFFSCCAGNKTRKRFGKKMFYHTMTHQVMSIVSRNENYERATISEPLILVPYSLEGRHPDYNLPVQDLSVQSEIVFIRQLSLILLRIKQQQSQRKVIFYCGSTHHYIILKLANATANNPFRIIFRLSERGIATYAKMANTLNDDIINYQQHGIIPKLTEPNIKKYLKKRGRNTNRKVWNKIILSQKKKIEKKIVLEQSEILVCPKNAYQKGFLNLYQQILGVVSNETI